MRRITTRTLLIGIALLAPLMALLASPNARQLLILGPLMAPLFLLAEETVYAPGYSEWAFRNVRVGMTEAEVRRLLGPSLRVGVTLALDPKTAPNRYWPKESLWFAETPSANTWWATEPPVVELPAAVAGRTVLDKTLTYSAHPTDGNGDHYRRVVVLDADGKVIRVEAAIWLD
jgi:hypothetical protein